MGHFLSFHFVKTIKAWCQVQFKFRNECSTPIFKQAHVNKGWYKATVTPGSKQGNWEGHILTWGKGGGRGNVYGKVTNWDGSWRIIRFCLFSSQRRGAWRSGQIAAQRKHTAKQEEAWDSMAYQGILSNLPEPEVGRLLRQTILERWDQTEELHGPFLITAPI